MARLTTRMRRVWRWTLLTLLTLGVLTAYAVSVRLGEREDASLLAAVEGITDELGRTLPPDYPRVRFVDVAAEAGLDFQHFSGSRSGLLPEDMGSGLSWGDYDGDGDEDLFVPSFAGPITRNPEELPGRPSALYRNDGQGRFVDDGAEAGVAARGFFMGGYFGDYDNDGDLDLFVTGYGGQRLYRNEGAGRFRDGTAESGLQDSGFSTGATWLDYDADGDLDLYVCRYVRFPAEQDSRGESVAQYGYAIPYTLNPASYEPEPNSLYRNDGQGRFQDVAAELGVEDRTGRSLGVTAADFDDDGDLDIYVADDVSKNALYRNRGDGTFEDWSAQSLAADYRGAMGMAVADHDEDGDLDLFISHWIAQENALYQNSLDVAPGATQPMFFDIADQVGLGAPGLDRVGWGSAFFDYDNDSRPDLFVTNGHTFEAPEDRSRLVPQRPQLFWNRGAEGFFDTSGVSGASLRHATVGRGLAVADYDADGDVDIALSTNGGPLALLRNDGGNGHSWIGFELVGVRSNRQGLGTRIRARLGERTLVAQSGTQGSYLSQSSTRVLLGLGDAQAIDGLELRWLSGQIDRLGPLPAGRVYQLREGGSLASGEAE